MIIISLLLLFSPNYFKFSNVIFRERYGIIITFCSFFISARSACYTGHIHQSTGFIAAQNRLNHSRYGKRFCSNRCSSRAMIRRLPCPSNHLWTREERFSWLNHPKGLTPKLTTFNLLSKRFSTQVENRSMKMLDSFLPRSSQPTIHSANKTASNAS